MAKSKLNSEGYKLIKKNIQKLFPYQVVSYFLALITMLISLSLVNLMRELVDTFQKRNIGIEAYFPLLLTCIAYLVFVAFFQFVFRRTQMIGRNEMVVLLYEKLHEKPLSFFKKYSSGEIISLINNEGREVGDWLSSGILVLFNQFTLLVLNLMLMFYYNFLLTLIICIIISIIYISTKSIATYIAKLSSSSYEVTGKINHFLIQTLKSETLINILDKQNWFKKRFNSIVYEQRTPIDRKRADYHAIYMTIFLFLSVLLPIITVIIGVFISASQNISIGTLLVFYALTTHIQEPIQYIPDYLSQRKNSITLAERLMPIMQDNDEKSDISYSLPEKVDNISISVAYHSYDQGKNKILENVNFEASHNDILLIKGSSGVGKTTLIDIIMGFIKSEYAKVIINNVDCSEISYIDLWNHILVVEQDPLLIEGTLEENLLLGDIFSTELIDEVIYTTCLDNFINHNRDKQIIGTETDGVSGGQKQRISLARMLLRKPDILILDEPTSALDEATSLELARRIVLFTKKHNIILLVISHKSDFDKYATSTIEIK